MQFADQPFYTQFPVSAGQDLFRIASSRGFDNPGPVIAYPPNKPLFEKRFGATYLKVARDFRLMPGDVLFVPWHPDSLRKTIATSEYLIREVRKDMHSLVSRQLKTKDDMNDLLFKIDAVNFLANIGAGVVALAKNFAAKGFTLGEEEVVSWFVDSRINVASNIATMAVPAPSEPKMDFTSFLIRHTLGPWNPSFWVTVYAAIDEGNVDYYLYGTDVVMSQNVMKIQMQATRDIQQLQNRIAAPTQQLQAPFYQHRI